MKSQLLMRDHYGRYFAALRCAEFILGSPSCDGSIELRLEDARFSPWDDLTEVHPDEHGHTVQHVWQVKRQRERLSRKSLSALLRALAEKPLLRAHLALYSLVEVPDMGSLTVLSEMCVRAGRTGFDPGSELELSAREKKWVLLARKLLGGSAEDAWRLFGRLEVLALGSEQELQRKALSFLQIHFTEPQRAYERLISFLSDSTDGAIRITPSLLEEKVLQGIPRRLVHGTASVASLRASYLSSVLDGYARLSPLRLLSGRGGPGESEPSLADVFSMPALRSTEDGEPPPIPRRAKLTGNVSLPGEEDEEFARASSRVQFLLRTDDLSLLDLLLDPNRYAERSRFLLEGGIGAGKSTILEYLRFRLAERAIKVADAPLPIRLEARDLAKGATEAAVRSTPFLDLRLFEAHPAGFIYLIDGLDEVEPYHTRAVQDCIDVLNRRPSTAAMVMAGRPATTYLNVPSGTIRLKVAPWSRGQIEEFLRRWRQHDPRRVTELERLTRVDALLPVLSNPLTATFALLLAMEEPESLRSRAGLFRGIVEKLFQDWVRIRSTPTDAAQLKWADVAPAFRRLALQSLKSGKDGLTRTDIRKHLASEVLDRDSEWLEQAHRRFGLLVYRPDGTYSFLLKGIAEHLAGDALLRQGHDALLGAAGAQWAEEPVRHAIGLGCDLNETEWAVTLLSKLLPGPEGIRVLDVRPLRVAAYAILDLGERGAALVEPVATALCRLLTLETSDWMPRVAADVIREAARLGGPLWESLCRKLTTFLTHRADAASWYQAQSQKPREWWIEALRHRSIDVRCVVINKLAAWVNDRDVRDALVGQLGDTHVPFHIPPAILAGRVLRVAARDEHFLQRLLPHLIQVAEGGGQLEAGAATLALHPGEAPARILVSGLRGLGMGGWVIREVIQSLAANPEGEAALDAGWEEWREARERFEAPTIQAMTAAGTEAPLSQSARREILYAMGPALPSLSAQERQQLGVSFDDTDFIRELCEAAWEHPQGAQDWLASSRPSWVPPDAELALGEAVTRHVSLREALLDSWTRCKSSHEQGLFPGGALSALVVQGDSKAAEIYAQWLRNTFWLKGGFESVFVSPGALRHPLVRPVAIQHAESIWREYKDGRIEGGRHVHLAGGAMASILGVLRPAWDGASELENMLLRLASDGGHDGLTDALGVYSRPPFPSLVRELLVENFAEFAEQRGDQYPWDVDIWIHWAMRASIADRLQPDLERLCCSSSWLRFVACSALISVQPERARQFSEQAARVWPDDWSSTFVRQSVLPRIVRANPHAWHLRLLEVLEQDRIAVQAVFRLSRILGPLLTQEQRKDFLLALYRRMGTLETHWVRMDPNSWEGIRFSDQYALILFETEAMADRPWKQGRDAMKSR